MKVLGVIMIHYGSDYLEYCLRSMFPVCEKVVILYSMEPTHQGRSDLLCPDTRSKLKAIADKFPTEWVDVYNKKGEGEHLGEIWNHTDGYDVLVRSDYDEVWEPFFLQQAVEQVYRSPYRNHGINGFINFWRSFDYYFTDGFLPVRLFHLREKNTQKEPAIRATVYHFGYAIKPIWMKYKLSIHGHRGELKADWFNIWDKWNPSITEGKFHPVSNDIWLNVQKFNKEDLPEFMKSHPYFNQQIIR